jgi:hypothetical protein
MKKREREKEKYREREEKKDRMGRVEEEKNNHGFSSLVGRPNDPSLAYGLL